MHGEIFKCAETLLNEWICETFPNKDAVTGHVLADSRNLDAFFERLISVVDSGNLFADLRLQVRAKKLFFLLD